jgi:hypothetical protein
MKSIKIVINKICILAFASSIFFLTGCSKGGDSPTPTSPTPPPVVITESDIAFKVDIAGAEVNYSNVFPVVGSSIQMNANITSTLPKDGVTIDISVKKKLDNAVVFSSNLSSSGASNPFTVTGLTGGTLCVATIIVTSKSKSSNASTKTFELVAK